MEEQQISEGNNMIAEFVGFEPKYNSVCLNTQESTEHKIALEYHKSWDSAVGLMNALEKIIKFKYEDGDTAYLRTFGMIKDEKVMVRFNRHQLFSADSLIQATWLAVVDFIKWYNEQNK